MPKVELTEEMLGALEVGIMLSACSHCDRQEDCTAETRKGTCKVRDWIIEQKKILRK